MGCNENRLQRFGWVFKLRTLLCSAESRNLWYQNGTTTKNQTESFQPTWFSKSFTANKGIFEIGPKTAEIDRGGLEEPPLNPGKAFQTSTWLGLSKLMRLNVQICTIWLCTVLLRTNETAVKCSWQFCCFDHLPMEEMPQMRYHLKALTQSFQNL